MVEFPSRPTINKGLRAGGIFALLTDPGAFSGLLIFGLGWMLIKSVGVGAESLSKDYRDDSVYKKNLQRLIERNREFENKE